MSRPVILILSLVLFAALAGSARAAEPLVIDVIENATIHWDKDRPELQDDGFVLAFAGQTARRTVRLPAPRVRPALTPRIVATVTTTPITSVREGRERPNDPWTRLGAVNVLVPSADGTTNTVVEILRFVTAYGAPSRFEQDVTALAPLLQGRRTFELFLSSYSDEPGWRVSLTLTFDDSESGYRRPVFAAPVFGERHITAEIDRRAGAISSAVVIPAGVARPRLRILSTGHSTDGQVANEFETSTHILRIDGVEVLRWRPWSELGGGRRGMNPWAGRSEIKGGTVWASDFDRSGWQPGLAIEPLVVPLPELLPGRHVIELEIDGIRPAIDAESPGHGYWVTSAVVVADEPLAPTPRPSGQ